MKGGIKIVLLFVTSICFSCSSVKKGIQQKKFDASNNITSENLYPSRDLVIPFHNDWTKEHYRERIASFKNNPLKFGDIVFLGNSITEQGGDWGSRLNNPIIKNRGISGDVTEGVLQRIKEICYYKPSAVFILIGINDVFKEALPVEYIAANDIKIAETIKTNSPNTKVYLLTILPTSNQNLVAKIKAVNDKLKKSASSNNFILIDLHSLFADGDDLIKSELTNDGVHLTEKGYTVWVKEVKQYF